MLGELTPLVGLKNEEIKMNKQVDVKIRKKEFIEIEGFNFTLESVQAWHRHTKENQCILPDTVTTVYHNYVHVTDVKDKEGKLNSFLLERLKSKMLK